MVLAPKIEFLLNVVSARITRLKKLLWPTYNVVEIISMKILLDFAKITLV